MIFTNSGKLASAYIKLSYLDRCIFCVFLENFGAAASVTGEFLKMNPELPAMAPQCTRNWDTRKQLETLLSNSCPKLQELHEKYTHSQSLTNSLNHPHFSITHDLSAQTFNLVVIGCLQFRHKYSKNQTRLNHNLKKTQ